MDQLPTWTRIKRRPQPAQRQDEAVDAEARLWHALGAVVVEQRLWLEWSRERLASEARVGLATLARLESGLHALSVGALRRIAEAMCLDISELFQLAEERAELVEAPTVPISCRSLTAERA